MQKARISLLVNTYAVRGEDLKVLLAQRVVVKDIPYWESDLNSGRINPQDVIDHVVKTVLTVAEDKFRDGRGSKPDYIRAEIIQQQIIIY